jgi:hypothetical protein
VILENLKAGFSISPAAPCSVCHAYNRPFVFAVELPPNTRVPLGRRNNNIHLNNLHISREQVAFELKPDQWGRTLICMTNVSPQLQHVLLFI